MQYRGQERVAKRPDGRIHVTLTDAQTGPLGWIVQHLFYSNDTLCDMIPNCGGYPHNGGEHTMYMYGSKVDIQAFLELAAEFYTNFAVKRPNYVDGAQMLHTLSREVAMV